MHTGMLGASRELCDLAEGSSLPEALITSLIFIWWSEGDPSFRLLIFQAGKELGSRARLATFVYCHVS